MINSNEGPWDGSDLPPEDLVPRHEEAPPETPMAGGGGGGAWPEALIRADAAANISAEATRWPSHGVKPFIGGMMI